jgi:hypothetical protein
VKVEFDLSVSDILIIPSGPILFSGVSDNEMSNESVTS